MALAQLEKAVDSRLGIRQFGGRTTLTWFYKGRKLNISDGRVLLSKLSEIFDHIYDVAPRINNELINRRSLSAAAAGARMRLIENLFTQGSKPLLGMNPDKAPPEMSMYLSVLKGTGLHRQVDGAWQVIEPQPRSDKGNLRPLFIRIREILQSQTDRRVGIPHLFQELKSPPFGAREGILPLLLATFAVAHSNEIVFYKDGSFLREMTGEGMLILTKAPERFEVQYCKILGVRAALFDKLIITLNLKRSTHKKVELLDVVKPLCVFVAELPPYVRNTKRLSSTALAVREAILNATEPAKLLFTTLPQSCGFAPVSPTSAQSMNRIPDFVEILKRALDELRLAYSLLQERMRQSLRGVFSLPGNFQQFRSALALRSEHVLLSVTEPKLRAFCLRILDDNLAESEWLESLGSNLALKPPSKWRDPEEDCFNTELAELAARFHRVEAISFSKKTALNGSLGVRVSVTQFNGVEHERVVHFNCEDEAQLLQLQEKFEALLADDRRLGLAAASRAIWKNLGNTPSKL